MYNCIMNELNNGLVVFKDSKEIAKVSIEYFNKNAYIDVLYFDKNSIEKEGNELELVKFASSVCNDVKNTLRAKGVEVEKVVFGTFKEVDTLDEYLEELKTITSEETYNKIKNKSPNKR